MLAAAEALLERLRDSRKHGDLRAFDPEVVAVVTGLHRLLCSEDPPADSNEDVHLGATADDLLAYFREAT